MKITLDKNSKGAAYKGLGMVSGNNSSRLLIDYKYKHPGKYNEILEAMFGKNGLKISHIKLEMGSDINSSSGTEPCVKRYENENADVTRGAGFILACDAKKINPEITLDMLYWSEPKWVADSSDVYAARYKWYKETLTAAYGTFGLKFDCISVSRNERDIDPEWIKYISAHMKSERDCPYDFSKIKIIAADEENAWYIADKMMCDSELCGAVDIICSHYTSHCTDNARLIAEKYGKEIWFSEGCPPMSYSKGTSRFDGSGLSGMNGVLDIACRIAAMYPCGGMNLYEFQPVAAAYYDGVCYCCKQLITANEPWSGHYSIDSGYYMALHFSLFFKENFTYIDSGCFFDGEKDGHTLINVKRCIMTAGDINSGDFSSVMVNPCSEEITYYIDAELFDNAPDRLYLWETRGGEGGAYDENYFVERDNIIPVKKETGCSFSVTLKPFSMATVSTVKITKPVFPKSVSEIMKLPYRDDFSYDESYLKQRGYAPEFTSDQGGAFEIRSVNGKNVLMQIITPEYKAEEWGATPLPVTSLGDDRWYNYSAAVNGHISESGDPSSNYIGAGLRYAISYKDMNGYSLLAFEDGHWELIGNNRVISKGKYETNGGDIQIKISADHNDITCFINGRNVCSHRAETGKALIGAGRAALHSSYNNNYFTGISVEPVGDTPYIARFDDTDDCFSYSAGWEHNIMSGFSDYKRTVSCGGAGESLTLDFTGTGFGIFGENSRSCTVSVWIDGGKYKENVIIPETGSREIFLSLTLPEYGRHTARIDIVSGRLNVDGAQIEGIK